MAAHQVGSPLGVSIWRNYLSQAALGTKVIPRPDGRKSKRTGRAENLKTATVILVGNKVADRANFSDGANAHPGVVRLISETGLSRDTVQQSLCLLRDLGWLTRTAEANSIGGKADVYQLTMGRDFVTPSAVATSPAPQAPDSTTDPDGFDQPDRISSAAYDLLSAPARDSYMPSFDLGEEDTWVLMRDEPSMPSRSPAPSSALNDRGPSKRSSGQSGNAPRRSLATVQSARADGPRPMRITSRRQRLSPSDHAYP